MSKDKVSDALRPDMNKFISPPTLEMIVDDLRGIQELLAKSAGNIYSFTKFKTGPNTYLNSFLKSIAEQLVNIEEMVGALNNNLFRLEDLSMDSVGSKIELKFETDESYLTADDESE